MLFRKTYSLAIPEPCHESWASMKPAGEGRYCESCTKVVTDFTRMSDREIAAFFKHRPQHVCGRLAAAQLQKTYHSSTINVLPLHKRALRYLLGLMLSGSALEKAHAQETVIQTANKDSLQKDSVSVKVLPVQNDSLASLTDSSGALADVTPTVPDSLVTWKPSISWPSPTFTMDVSVIVTGGAICIIPQDPWQPWSFIMDSLGQVLRKKPLKKSADKTRATTALKELPSTPHVPHKVPVKLPEQQAIVVSALQWKRRNRK